MRREDTNEWVTISDLMAGVAAMIMLLLVVTFVQASVVAAENERKKRQGVESAIADIREILEDRPDIKGVIIVDKNIRLTDQSFRSGSACLSDETRLLLEEHVAPIIINTLKTHPNISIQIEGHTDPMPVAKICTDLSVGCALFDDNYSLSAGRAREARKALISSIEQPDILQLIGQKTAVVGYGPDRLLNTEDQMASENRRVEIKLIVLDDVADMVSIQNE